MKRFVWTLLLTFSGVVPLGAQTDGACVVETAGDSIRLTLTPFTEPVPSDASGVCTLFGGSTTETISVVFERYAEPAEPLTLAAFPEAMGGGSDALARCRDLPLVVHEVTDWPSLLAMVAAVRNDRFDVVLFPLGGRIVASGDARMAAGGCAYIAGQTAPGGGITVAGGRLRIDRATTDVVLRYLTWRKCANSCIQIGGQSEIYPNRTTERVVVDHVSSSWAGINIASGGSHPLVMAGTNWHSTAQWNLLAEPAHGHPTVHSGPGQYGSIVRNLLVGPGSRLPMCSRTIGAEVVQNLVYNWRENAGTFTLSSLCDFVANRFIAGPATPTSPSHRNRVPLAFRDQCDEGFHPTCDYTSIYLSGNEGPYLTPGDQWGGVRCDYAPGRYCAALNELAPVEIRRDQRLQTIPGDVPDGPMTDALAAEILEWAGNSRGVACDGSWYRRRDAVDERIVTNVRNGTGATMMTDMTQSRGADQPPVVPVPASGQRCPDRDDDGLPDAWEARYGERSPDEKTPSGYLVIEHYLNGTVPQ